MNNDVTPFDLINNKNYTTRHIRDERYDICKSCENFTITKQCAICYCFMSAKTWLKNAHCPLHKWEAVDDSGGTAQ